MEKSAHVANSASKAHGKVRLNRQKKDLNDVPLKDIEYVAIGKVLNDYVNAGNVSTLGESSPYGFACNVLGWENSVLNRFFLCTIWKENRCNLRDKLVVENDLSSSRSLEVGSTSLPKTRKRKHAIGKNSQGKVKRNKINDNSSHVTKEDDYSPEHDNIAVKSSQEANENVVLAPKLDKIDNSVYHITDRDNSAMQVNEKGTSAQQTNNNIQSHQKRTKLSLKKNPKRYQKEVEISILNTNDNNEIAEKIPILDTETPESPKAADAYGTCTATTISNYENDHAQQNYYNDKSPTNKNDNDDLKAKMTKFDNNHVLRNNRNDTLRNLKKKNLTNLNSSEKTKSDNKKFIQENLFKYRFDEQCLCKCLLEKDTKSIFRMLESFFTDNEMCNNTTFIALFSVYNSTKKLIASFKSFLEKKDIEKEYKDLKEMFMKDLLAVDNFEYLPECDYIKKSISYLINCALNSLDKMYKKNKAKGWFSEIYEKGNNLNVDDKPDSIPVQDLENSPDSLFGRNGDEPDFGPLSRETISSILETDIPDRYFTKVIPRIASFKINESDMKHLLSNRNGRSFRRDSWQSLFFQKVKETNPYCCFQVLRSRLSTAAKRKRKFGSPFFLVLAKCTFVDCTMTFKLEMHDNSTAKVTFTGDLKHDIKEIRHRPIKGEARDQLKNQFKGGIKPMAHYLEQLQKLPTEYLVSGNRDGLGKNSRVFAQIAAESRQAGRMDDSVFQSLQELKEEMKLKVNGGGFIQKICASPCYILYWSKFGIELYNERAKKDALYWDATGSVVRKQEDGKQFLYYELAIRNPIKGKMGIPLTAMLTSDQSLSTVLDWIRCFRQAEKQRYGHNNTKIVKFPTRGP